MEIKKEKSEQSFICPECGEPITCNQCGKPYTNTFDMVVQLEQHGINYCSQCGAEINSKLLEIINKALRGELKK